MAAAGLRERRTKSAWLAGDQREEKKKKKKNEEREEEEDEEENRRESVKPKSLTH